MVTRCVPAEADGRCSVRCKTGYVASGDLLCFPAADQSASNTSLQWSTVTCDLPGRDWPSQVQQTLTLHGLQARSDMDKTLVAEALQRAFAQSIAVSVHLIKAVVQQQGRVAREDSADGGPEDALHVDFVSIAQTLSVHLSCNVCVA